MANQSRAQTKPTQDPLSLSMALGYLPPLSPSTSATVQHFGCPPSPPFITSASKRYCRAPQILHQIPLAPSIVVDFHHHRLLSGRVPSRHLRSYLASSPVTSHPTPAHRASRPLPSLPHVLPSVLSKTRKLSCPPHDT